jgi:A/G-specific adenine glycosylase
MPPERSIPPPARAAAIRRRLLAWWDAGHRDLPWRFPPGKADPYRVWLSEVMLQQTRVEAVVPYYRRFLERWPELRDLAAADDAEVLSAWSGLGYYARCRNLLAAAREAVSVHGGIPASAAALARLPGFGPYTVGAVGSIAFGLPLPAVDGNAVRVLSRLFRVGGDRQSPEVKRRLGRLAAAILDRRRPGEANQALMELGATTCRPRRPRCAACPLAVACGAHAAGREGDYPERRARRAPVVMRLSLARVERGGRLLLARAPEGGLFPGMWGLPGVVVPTGEDPAGFLASAARGMLGLGLEIGPELATVTRLLTHRRLELRVHAARLVRGSRPDPARLRFTTEAEASSLPAATAMKRAIEASGGWTAGPKSSGRQKTSPRSGGRP